MLSLPPRHGKSEQVTVRLPSYVLEFDPDFRWIIGAYNQNLANKFSRKTRRICLDRGVPLSKIARKVDDWETDTGAAVPGGLRAAGVKVGITGMGANGVIVDDPVKNRKEANSPTYRDDVFDWYKDDLYTRLEPLAFVIVIMTRWHEDDLAGRILREEGKVEDGGEWTVINLPALAEENDPLGRALGEALCPERYDEKALDRIKGVLHESFYALFQGRPVPASGNVIKRKWFRYVDTIPADNVVLATVQSWDTAEGKDATEGAWSVCTTWKITRLGLYLVDVYRERINYPTLRAKAVDLAERWKPTAILIEDKSTGSSLLQDCRNETRLPVVEIEPEGDKLTRLMVESVAYESGLVHHLAGAPWLTDCEEELLAFPFSQALDQADSISQLLRWARKRSYSFAWESAGPSSVSEMFGDNGGRIDTSTGWGRVAGRSKLEGY